MGFTGGAAAWIGANSHDCKIGNVVVSLKLRDLAWHVIAAPSEHVEAALRAVGAPRHLRHLMYKHPTNQTAVAAAGGIEAVMAALRAHVGAEAVQQCGCIALRHLRVAAWLQRCGGRVSVQLGGPLDTELAEVLSE